MLLYVAAWIWVKCEEAVRVRLLLAESGDWDVVEVTGYYEGSEPSLAGYSVTGALLATKGRPEAAVRVFFYGLTSLRDNDKISIVEMKTLKSRTSSCSCSAAAACPTAGATSSSTRAASST